MIFKFNTMQRWRYFVYCALFIFLSNFSLQASVLDGFITIQKQNVPLKNVLDIFETETGKKIAYIDNLVDVEQSVSVDIKEKSVDEALSLTLSQLNLAYHIESNKIIIKPKPVQSKPVVTAAKKKYSGVILDETGEPVIGANVVIKNTQNGTITGLDGTFEIEAEPGAILFISYIGYDNYEMKLGDKEILSIHLSQNTKLLEDVVVIGYGTMRKSDFTGSLANVKADELSLSAPTLGQALVGKIAGVQVSQPSGAPGEGTKIRVRGVNSLSAGSAPLYVVDGYPASEEVYINPEDIESIDVLKDAASAAIYGSRGAGGVVLITTKRGSTGKARVDYDYQYSVHKLERKIKVLDAYGFRDLVIDARNNAYRDRAEAAGVIWSPLDDNATRVAKGFSMAEVGIDPIFFDFTTGKAVDPTYNTDWQDALYSSAPVHRHNIAVSGGNEALKYRMSVGYLDQDGIISPSNHKRMNLRANVDAQVTRRLRVGLNLSFTDVKDRKVQASGRFLNDGVVQSALMSYPQFPVYNEDGSYAVGNMIAMKANGYAQVENPVALAHEIDINQRESRINFNTNISFEILKGFTANANLGSQYTTRRYNYYRPRSVGQDGDMPYSVGAEARVVAKDQTNYDTDQLGEFTLNYNKSLGFHKFDAVAGYSLQKKQYDRVGIETKGHPNDLIHELTAHGADPSDVYLGSTRKAAWTMMSYFGRVNYYFDNRYSLSVTVRTDGSSRFGPSNKWGWFPSASAGWNISNEKFYRENLGENSTLKLRLSWGLSGNNNIGNYEVYSVMSQGGYPFGGGTETAYWQGGFKDQSIGWETTSQFNAGFDLTLFNNRVSLIGNYYNSLSYNLLYDMPVSAISGSTSITTNLSDAKVRNRGIDLQLDTRILTGAFKWDVGANISLNRNKVLDLGGINDIYLVSERNVVSYVTKAGLPIGSFYGYQVDGIISEAEYEKILIDKNVWINNGNQFPDGYQLVGPAVPNYNNIHAGDTKWKDVDDDGRITEDDRDILGNAFPDFTYGFNTTFSYKGFDLSATFSGSQGAQVINFQKYYLFGLEGYSNQLVSALDRWKSDAEPGKNNVHRASRASTPNISTRLSSYMVDDASYLRCTNITLGYNVPKSFLSKMSVQALRVYVSVDNVFTITNYEGYNPDVDYKDDNLMPGFDWGDYPLARMFSLGAKITF